MIREPLWRRSSRSLAALFLGVAAAPALTLVWLGLQLLHEDRALLAQRDVEHRQWVQEAVIRSLEQSVADAERHVVDGPVPQGTLRLIGRPEGVEAQPRDRVLWVPQVVAMPPAESERFVEAERFEFQGGLDRALVVYTEAAKAARREVRAGALLRLARVHRSRKEWDHALQAYRDLAGVTDVSIERAPADLQGRRAICSILQETGRSAELQREASRIETDMLAGRWTLDRAAWELTSRDIERWTGHRVTTSEERRLFSEGADALLPHLYRPRQPRHLVVTGSDTVLALSRQQGDNTFILEVTPAVQRAWTEQARAHGHELGTTVTLLRADGALAIGGSAAPAPGALKATASDSGLPWTVLTSFSVASPASAELASRQRLLSVGLAAILLFFLGGSYFLWRVMRRELAVARLQTDFVSAVSHEFRTPLTSIRHAAELLTENDNVPVERRLAFYEALDRSAVRLHRLVDSLLDFSRMEAGRKPYDLRPMDVSALTADVVAEFQKEVHARGYTVDLTVEPDVPTRLRADEASLTNALWNVLDNAVKYSPDDREIHVSLESCAGGVAITVRDHGLGVPEHERDEIFRRFVRGEQAKRLGIKGTGLGLAMVSHILEAHGGRLELDSEEGVGSTFRMVLPVAS